MVVAPVSWRLLLLGLAVAVLLSVSAASKPHPASSSKYSYGRAFGSVVSYYRKDKGNSHHLELNFSAIVDLDTSSRYTNFQANINVRSNDGSDILVAAINGSALAKAASVLRAVQGAPGVKRLHASEGLQYSSFLTAASFVPMSEDAVVALYVSTLKLAAPNQVFVFGQLYNDRSSHGIHDIHRIVSDKGQFRDYGDGGFIVRDARGNYYGVFTHFNNQPATR